MNIKQLETYRAVMIMGSITAGGEMLHVSQPGVSHLIRDLEQAVGFKLFVREKGRISPTAEGTTFYKEIDKTFLGLERLKQTAYEIREMQKGSLRVAAMPSVSLEFIPDVIKKFNFQHQDVKIIFDTYISLRVIESVANQDFDVGIAQLSLDEKGVHAVQSYSMHCVCVAPLKHRFTQLRSVSPDDLRDEPFIALSKNTLIAVQIDRVLQRYKLRKNICFETQPSFAACSLVSKGLGVALVDPLTAEFFGNNRIVTRPFTHLIPFNFKIIRPAHSISSLSAEVFIDKLQEKLAAHDLIHLA